MAGHNIKDWLSYDEISGLFTRIRPTKGQALGKIAGTLKSNGYVSIYFKGKHYYAHRLAWWWITGKFPEFLMDHKNGVRSDNRIVNLRPCSKEQNAWNRSFNDGSNIEKLPNNSYRVRLSIKNKTTQIGIYKTFDEALEAKINALNNIRGSFVRQL